MAKSAKVWGMSQSIEASRPGWVQRIGRKLVRDASDLISIFRPTVDPGRPFLEDQLRAAGLLTRLHFSQTQTEAQPMVTEDISTVVKHCYADLESFFDQLGNRGLIPTRDEFGQYQSYQYSEGSEGHVSYTGKPGEIEFEVVKRANSYCLNFVEAEAVGELRHNYYRNIVSEAFEVSTLDGLTYTHQLRYKSTEPRRVRTIVTRPGWLDSDEELNRANFIRSRLSRAVDIVNQQLPPKM